MSTNGIDRILALPVDERAPGIVETSEDQWFERKSIRIAPKDLAVPLVALANAEGGTVVVGAHRGDRRHSNSSRPGERADAGTDRFHSTARSRPLRPDSRVPVSRSMTTPMPGSRAPSPTSSSARPP